MRNEISYFVLLKNLQKSKVTILKDRKIKIL